MSVSCQEVAMVTEVTKEGAVVKIRRAEACHACAARGACQSLGGKTEDISLVVENTLDARPGDMVVLTLPESSVIKASAVLYLLPASGLVAGALAGWLLGPKMGFRTDPASIIGSLVGLVVGLGLAHLAGKRMGRDKRYIPRLTAIKSRGGE